MNSTEVIELVNRQISYHERSRDKAIDNQNAGSAETHQNMASTWRDAFSSLKQIVGQASSPAHDDATVLRPEDLEGLPEELLLELNQDELEIKIQRIIKKAGGTMSLDRLMIGLYREHGELHRRRQLTQKLYRMASKGALYSVPRRKAVYSILPQDDSLEDEPGETHAPENEGGDIDDLIQ